MEFKLNKIDTDIRKKLQEQIKEDKVHGNESIRVKKDIKEDNKYKKNNKDCNEKNNKKLFTINGIKYSHKVLKIKGEKVENLNDENSKGRILDTKK